MQSMLQQILFQHSNTNIFAPAHNMRWRFHFVNLVNRVSKVSAGFCACAKLAKNNVPKKTNEKSGLRRFMERDPYPRKNALQRLASLPVRRIKGKRERLFRGNHNNRVSASSCRVLCIGRVRPTPFAKPLLHFHHVRAAQASGQNIHALLADFIVAGTSQGRPEVGLL